MGKGRGIYCHLKKKSFSTNTVNCVYAYSDMWSVDFFTLNLPPLYIYVKWKGLKNKTSKFENNILSRKHTALELKNSLGSKSLHCSCDKLQCNSLKKNQVVA